jgi:DNA-binding Xre family transcriptional regulator
MSGVTDGRPQHDAVHSVLCRVLDCNFYNVSIESGACTCGWALSILPCVQRNKRQLYGLSVIVYTLFFFHIYAQFSLAVVCLRRLESCRYTTDIGLSRLVLTHLQRGLIKTIVLQTIDNGCRLYYRLDQLLSTYWML